MNWEIRITNKVKTAKNKWKNDDSDFLPALYSVYNNFFSILTRELVKRKTRQFCWNFD